MSRSAPVLLACAALMLASAVGAASATAYYGSGAMLVSADYVRLEQGDDTTVFAAISGDGRYVAIQTRARNFFADDDPDPPGKYRAGGVFRFDLVTRALAKIADGDLFDEQTNAFLRRGASSPSISADGRYVAFATAESLLPADGNDNVDVYVRDMNLDPGQAGAYDLVSARDGGDLPASYGPPANPFPGSNLGADVSRGVAISADGRKVAFRTDAVSDLPASATTDVPAGQVLVRDRSLDTTTLATRTASGGAPAGGALGAAISADGTTVAWTGGNAAAQTPFLNGENDDPSFLYYLWRRIADGPGAATRRVTGLADPDDPACPPGVFTNFDQISTGPCYGPLTDQEGNRSGISAQLPVLSGDGYEVAFLTGSGPRPLAFTGPSLDLWLTDMHAGLTRKQATTELSRDPVGLDPATTSPISSVAMSAQGRYLAMATVRTTFALPALQLSGAPRAIPDVRELYVVDLQNRTRERATRSTTGGDIDGDVQNGLTISDDGERVAFTSFAGNLFYGDANQRADAFVVTREPDPGAAPPPVDPGAGGPSGTIEEEPKVKGTAKSGKHGLVRVTIEAPAAGGVKAVANASAGKPRKRRTLATATGRAEAAGPVELVLRPVRRYRGELRERGKIRGRALLSFVPAVGGRRLTGSVKVVFRP